MNTGADLASTATAGDTCIINGSTTRLVKVRAVSGGIYGCSLSINLQSTTDVFYVYYWSSETAVPT